MTLRGTFCAAVLAACCGCGTCDGQAPTGPRTGAAAAKAADTIEATAAFELEPGDDGTFELRWGTATIVRTQYRFFGEAFRWAKPEVTTAPPAADGSLTFEIEVDALATHIKGTASRTAARTFEVRYTVEHRSTVTGIEGGGLEFELRPLDSLVARGAKKTELIDDDTGFNWPLGAGESLRVGFEGDDVRVFFERGKPTRVRAFFVGQDLAPGTRTVTMRVELPPSGTVVPSLAERYAAPSGETWHAGTLAWDVAPVDVSFLNADDRPAGKHGRVHVEGDKLVRPDGTEIRLWGANVTAGALFNATRDDVAAQAKRLAAFGFNLVRLHHHDSAWVKPNVFERSSGGTRVLRDASLANLDWWVECLRNEGIYVWLDLHVGRSFTGADGIVEHPELPSSGSGKGLNYVNDSIEDRMQEFAAAYLNRENRFSQTRYTEEPGVLAVLVTNENDLTFHGVRPLVAGSRNRSHVRMLAERARPFLRRAGFPSNTLKNLRAPGPAKVVLAELEARFAQRAIVALETLGYSGPVVTTSFFGKTPLYAIPATTVGSFIDAHTYGQAEFLRSDPRHDANFVSWIAGVQVGGMPMTVSEWNVPLARDRFVAPLFFASVAALQEWDATAFYAYSQHAFPPPARRDQWSSLRDAGSMAMMPAAAVMFRQGHVSPARTTYRLQLPREDVYGRNTSAKTSRAVRTLTEVSRIELGLPDLPELEWDTPRPGRAGATVTSALEQDHLRASETSVTSDTGELRRDWAAGVHTIDTARTAAVQGWVGGRDIDLGAARFSVETPKAAVALTSLDGQPLATSRRILVTAVAQVESLPGTVRPLYAEPVAGEIVLRSSVPRLELVPLRGAHAAVGAPIFSVASKGMHTITLPTDRATHWFELRPAPADSP